MMNIFARSKMYQCQRCHFIVGQKESCVPIGRNSTVVSDPALFVFVKLLNIQNKFTKTDRDCDNNMSRQHGDYGKKYDLY